MATANQGMTTTAVARPSLWKRTREGRIAASYLLPAFLVMAVMTFYPLVFQVWMSFTNYGTIRQPDGKFVQSFNPFGNNYRPAEWIGLQNYSDIVTNKLAVRVNNFDFWRILGFNIWWTISNVVFHVSLGIAIAVLLNIEGLWFKRIYRAIYILPMVLPNLVIATIWRNMLDEKNGALNMGLKLLTDPLNTIFTLFGAPPLSPEFFNIRWLTQIEEPIPGIPLTLSYFGMLIANIWLGWPLMTVVATGALQSIPRELYEAASIDGATGWQQFWKITLPLLRPAMVPAAMVGMVMTFNLFHIIYFIAEGGPLGKTEILVTQAYKLMRPINGEQLFGMAAAFSIFIFFILGPIFLLTNKIARATESYDG